MLMKPPESDGRNELHVVEAGHLFAVQRVLRLSRYDHRIPFVEFYFHCAVDTELRLIDEVLQQVSFGSEPVAVVDQLSKLLSKAVFEVRDFAIQRDGFQRAVSLEKDRDARRFVDAP